MKLSKSFSQYKKQDISIMFHTKKLFWTFWGLSNLITAATTCNFCIKIKCSLPVKEGQNKILKLSSSWAQFSFMLKENQSKGKIQELQNKRHKFSNSSTFWRYLCAKQNFLFLKLTIQTSKFIEIIKISRYSWAFSCHNLFIVCFKFNFFQPTWTVDNHCNYVYLSTIVQRYEQSYTLCSENFKKIKEHLTDHVDHVKNIIHKLSDYSHCKYVVFAALSVVYFYNIKIVLHN